VIKARMVVELDCPGVTVDEVATFAEMAASAAGFRVIVQESLLAAADELTTNGPRTAVKAPRKVRERKPYTPKAWKPGFVFEARGRSWQVWSERDPKIRPWGDKLWVVPFGRTAGEAPVYSWPSFTPCNSDGSKWEAVNVG
jgi:hypothetical protein